MTVKLSKSKVYRSKEPVKIGLSELTEQEKYEKDFKQFSLLTLRMIAQSHETPRQLRRLKVMCNFLTVEIKNFEEKNR